MVNTARQGAAFERRVIHDLSGDGAEHEGYGYTCTRSAASKGAVDIVAVHQGPLNGGARLILGIQCKLSDPQISPAERLAVQDWALCAGAIPIVAWWAEDETTGLKRVHYRQLTGPGPKDWAPWVPGEDD